jgi:uncharacterized membrane protein YfcA
MQPEKKVIAAMTVLTSLAFYWFAKANGKQETPYVMIGGFLGSILGDAIAENIRKNNPNLNSYNDDDTDY